MKNLQIFTGIQAKTYVHYLNYFFRYLSATYLSLLIFIVAFICKMFVKNYLTIVDKYFLLDKYFII